MIPTRKLRYISASSSFILNQTAQTRAVSSWKTFTAYLTQRSSFQKGKRKVYKIPNKSMRGGRMRAEERHHYRYDLDLRDKNEICFLNYRVKFILPSNYKARVHSLSFPAYRNFAYNKSAPIYFLLPLHS